jgi:hypothetical protein
MSSKLDLTILLLVSFPRDLHQFPVVPVCRGDTIVIKRRMCKQTSELQINIVTTTIMPSCVRMIIHIQTDTIVSIMTRVVKQPP